MLQGEKKTGFIVKLSQQRLLNLNLFLILKNSFFLKTKTSGKLKCSKQ
jgi:hypothetical protein